eukprot:jgi/Botrbrau1/10697/Bobra.357_1s0001.1
MGRRAAKICLLPALYTATLAFVGLCRASAGSKDYIDSPFTGQGVPPENGTTVYLSIYLDRLIHLNQQEYFYHAVLGVFLSWYDERAHKSLEEANRKFAKTKECDRPCSNTQMLLPPYDCCDNIWLPSFIIRNIDEYPQGRSQPMQITVRDNVVTWRVQLAGHFYTPMDLRAFPYDTQHLMLHMQLLNPVGHPKVKVVTSSTGTSLFSKGKGDDLSGWVVRNLSIQVSEQPFQHLFEETTRAYSNPRDPAPLIPNPVSSHAEIFNGGDITDVDVQIIIDRLSNYFSLNSILPVAVCTMLSFLTFFVQPDKFHTRLQLVVTLFLSLVAIEFVMDNELPRASYILPTRQLVIVSYAIFTFVAIETLVVYNVANYDKVTEFFQGQQRSRQKRAEMYKRARKEAGLDTMQSRIENVFKGLTGHGSFLVRSGRRWSISALSGHRARHQHRDFDMPGEQKKTIRDTANEIALEKSDEGSTSLSDDLHMGETNSPPDPAVVPVSQLEISRVDIEKPPDEHIADVSDQEGWKQANVSEKWRAMAMHAKVEKALGGAKRLNMMMCDEDRKWYFMWLAWMIDMYCFAFVIIGYGLTGMLIFLINARRSNS